MTLAEVFRESVRALVRAAGAVKPDGSININAAASAWDFPQRTLASWLKKDVERSDPRLSTIEEFAAKTKCQPWQLLTPKFDPDNKPQLQYPAWTALQEAVVAKIAEMPEKKLRGLASALDIEVPDEEGAPPSPAPKSTRPTKRAANG